MHQERRVHVIVVVLLVGTAAILASTLGIRFYFQKPGPWHELTIATATTGGTYHKLGTLGLLLLGTVFIFKYLFSGFGAVLLGLSHWARRFGKKAPD